ncbi:hypothetical protein Dimus_023382 [Dionaea muscipula]
MKDGAVWRLTVGSGRVAEDGYRVGGGAFGWTSMDQRWLVQTGWWFYGWIDQYLRLDAHYVNSAKDLLPVFDIFLTFLLVIELEGAAAALGGALLDFLLSLELLWLWASLCLTFFGSAHDWCFGVDGGSFVPSDVMWPG